MPMKLVIDKGLTNCPNEEIQAQFDRLCDEQEKIDSTGFGEVFKCLNEVVLKGANRSVLFPFTEDVKAIQKALELTGHSKDEAFCERFMRHYRLFVEGKDLQARGLQIKASCLPQSGKQAGGWYFVPISIFVPQEAKDIQAAVNDILEKDAKEGKGLFANVTQIEKEDEALDEFLCVEAYNCKHSFTKYLAELKQHKVVGKEGAFLNPDFTRCLFATLKTCADIIKDNTDSPNNVKNKLNDVIATFDNIPIWGLFFQILVLQGLCQMLVSLDINEGDNGFDEAQDLCNWICEALETKEIYFAFGFYGDKDLVMLEPFCEYLCTTDVGKEIQEQIRREYYPEPQPEATEQEEIPQEQASNSQTPKEKGRPAKPFKCNLMGDEEKKAATLKKLHSLIDGKQGKDVALVILAAMKKGWLTRPTYTQVENEFGHIGDKTGYNKYLKAVRYTEEEIEGAINSLE